jgi:hypothetical protein
LGFGFWVLGFGFSDYRLRVDSFDVIVRMYRVVNGIWFGGLRVIQLKCSGFRDQGLRSRGWGWGLGFRVHGLGLGIWG